MTASAREAFLAAGRVAADLLSAPEVEAAWEGPSALPEFSVRGLAGHLLRATGSVEAYLDRAEPDDAPVSAAEYYVQAVPEPDIHSDVHRAIRRRGEDEAAGGYAAVRDRSYELLDRLGVRLAGEPANRKVRAYKDIALSIEALLETARLKHGDLAVLRALTRRERDQVRALRVL